MIRPTRLIPSSIAPEVFLKLECELPTGSFKVRGALYALGVHMQRRQIREVVTASTGNHGAAVAFAARQHGITAAIFLPRNPNRVKAEKIARLGARLEERGADLAEARAAADRYALETGAFVLDDATVPEIPIGAGTMAVEILDAMPDVRTIVRRAKANDNRFSTLVTGVIESGPFQKRIKKAASAGAVETQ
jgi:threonine dehydratase